MVLILHSYGLISKGIISMSSATTLAPAGLEVVPTGAALGVEVRGADLRSLDEAEFAAFSGHGSTIRWYCFATSV